MREKARKRLTVRRIKDKISHRVSLKKIYRAMVYAMPGVLCFSYYPVIRLGASESMNFELSLPLIWLVTFDVVTLVLAIKKRKVFVAIKRKWWLWVLFPIFVTLSILWSLNFARGVLTVGILWLIYFAVYGMWSLRGVLKEDGFKEKFWKVFFGSYSVICLWCVVQCILDLSGIGRDASLMCAGCTYQMFGFPHPNGMAIEPQFMGNLLLAPVIVSGWFALKEKKYLVLLFVFSATLFLTFSRGAIYALVVAIAFMTILEIVRQKSWKTCKIWLVIVVAFVFTLNMQGLMAAVSPTNDTYGDGVAKVLNHLSLGIIDIRNKSEKADKADKDDNVEVVETQVVESMENEFENMAVFDGYVVESTDARVKLSGAAVEVWKKDFGTVLFGVGLGGAGQALYINGLSASPKEIIQNEYASLLLETGLVGVALLMLTIVLIVRVMRKSVVMPMLLTLMVAYGVTLMFFSGLPNALHIYLLPAVLWIYPWGEKSGRKGLARKIE